MEGEKTNCLGLMHKLSNRSLAQWLTQYPQFSQEGGMDYDTLVQQVKNEFWKYHPQPLQYDIFCYSVCLVIHLGSHVQDLTDKQVNQFREWGNLLMQYSTQYSMEGDIQAYYTKMIPKLLKTTTFQQLNAFKSFQIQCKDNFGHSTQLTEGVFQTKFQQNFSRKILMQSIQEAKDFLLGILMLQELKVNMEAEKVERYKNLGFAAIFTIIRGEDVPKEERKSVIGMMNYVKFEKQSWQGILESLIREFGINEWRPLPPIPPSPQPSPSSQPLPSPQPSPSPYPITSKDQLRLAPNDKYVRNKPHISCYVREGTFEWNGETISIVTKEYVSPQYANIEPFMKELEILRALSETNLSMFLRFYGHYLDKTENHRFRLGLVMENCQFSLMDTISNLKYNRGQVPQAHIYWIVQTLIQGLKIIHMKKYAHLDIKPHNIFLTSAGDCLKIADFNISQTLDVAGSQTTIGDQVLPIQGTQGYMAPEIQKLFNQFKQQRIDKKDWRGRFKPGRADVFGLGMTFLQVYYLEDMDGLNTEERNHELLMKIGQVRYDWLRNLLFKMLKLNPEERIRVSELNTEIHPQFASQKQTETEMI